MREQARQAAVAMHELQEAIKQQELDVKALEEALIQGARESRWS